MKDDYTQFELWLGLFEGEEFKWKTLKSFSSFDAAYSEYKKFVNKQLSYSDDELYDIWKSARLDIEIRQGKKMLNWVGIYSKKQTPSDEDEEDDKESAKE